MHRVRERAALPCGRGGKQGQYGGCAAQVGHAVLDDQRKDHRRVDRAQAHVRPAHRRDRPRETPAVAVEQRQRPQIDGLGRQWPDTDVAHRFEESSPMVVDHAFGAPGGTGGVVQRDRVGLAARQRPCERRVAVGNESLVLHCSEPPTRPGIERVVDVDHVDLALELRQRRPHHASVHAVSDHHLGRAVLEDIGDRVGIEPRVDRIEHGAEDRHAVVRIKHRRDIRQHHSDDVAALYAEPGQRRSQPARALVVLRISDPQAAVDHGHPIRVDLRRARQERDRGQWRMVGGP